MLLLQGAALAIVVFFVVARCLLDRAPRQVVLRFLLLALSSWLAENSVITLYGFYRYSPDWSLFIDHVPLAIILIWPVVIHSAWDLARHCLTNPSRVPLLAATIVLADASMIEPISVAAGLWQWTEPGLFKVPPIGILGWALFSLVAVFLLEKSQDRRALLLLIPLPPLLVHPLLLACWWGFFRWVNQPINAWWVAVPLCAFSLVFSVWLWKRKIRHRIPLLELNLRLPAALFFFVLLALYGGGNTALYVYACAFAPPYLVLSNYGAFSRKPRTEIP
jgi:hypothetical protein